MMDSFRFYQVNPYREVPAGESSIILAGEVTDELTGVQGGGTITGGYYTDLKWQAQIDMLGSNLKENQLVRVIFDRDGEEHILGTFFVERKDSNLLRGALTTTPNMYSTLKRFMDTESTAGDTYAAGGNILNTIRSSIKANKGTCIVAPEVNSAMTFASAHVVEQGEKQLVTLNKLCEYLGCGSLDVNPEGEVTIAPYVSPSLRPAVWSFAQGSNCTIQAGIGISEDASDVPNFVIVRWTEGDQKIVKTAAMDDNLPWSFAARGRRVDRAYSLTGSMSESQVQAYADARMAEFTHPATIYRIRHTYAPITIGDAVELHYQDGGGVNIDCRCFVQEMRMTLVAGLPCETILRRVSV